MMIMFDPFSGEGREEAAIEAHAQALATISPALVEARVAEVMRGLGRYLPEVEGHEETIRPAVEREMFRLAAERRRVAHWLARLAGRDPLDVAMVDGLALHVIALVAHAQAEARKTLRNPIPQDSFPSEPE